MSISWEICLLFGQQLLIAYHVRRHINIIACTCQVLNQRESCIFAWICEAVETMDLLHVQWQPQSAQCLQDPNAPSFFCLIQSKVLVICLVFVHL